jgi:hypothetical protein
MSKTIRHLTGPNKGKLNQDLLQVKGKWSFGDTHPTHTSLHLISNLSGKQKWGTTESLKTRKASRDRSNKARDHKKMAQSTAQWRLNNPEKHRISVINSRTKRKANGKANAAKREYNRKNPHIVAKYNRQARAKRIANGKDREYWNRPYVRMCMSLRQRLYATIKRGRKSSSMELFGATRNEIIQHLENQFTDDMSWDNYGYYGWHIDHIMPVASYDLTNPKQQQECFHYTNLQPLWAEDNRRKSASIPHTITNTNETQ